jgi:rubrerythrin
MRHPITRVEEFYAHALAIEREAVDRYEEFQAWFSDRDEPVLAGLCANLAQLEAVHLREIELACRGLTLPPVDASGYRWLEAGPPEAPARELFYRIAEPRQLLEIALQAESNALAFFEWVERTTSNAQVRAVALEMAAEEQQHVVWAAQALEYHPSRPIDWEAALS